MKKLFLLQSILLLSGTLFAWSTVTNDYFKFLAHQAQNPLTTPCFYGAIGFLLAYFYSLYIYFLNGPKQKKHQKYLMIALIGGTLFGWGNFTIELCRFYIFKNPTSCSGGYASTPFLTPCFFGSVLYLLSLISSIVTLKKYKLKN